MRLRRSLLFVNGNDNQKFDAAVKSDADAIVLELEDGIPASQKEGARENVYRLLTECDFRGKEKVVRINPYNTRWGKQDVEKLLPARPDAFRLTKCEIPKQIQELDEIVSKFEKENCLPDRSIEFILTIESPLGIINAYELATSCARVTAIGLGAADFTCALDVDRIIEKDTLQLLYVKQKLVVCGKAAGVQVIDTTVVSQENVDDFVKYDTDFIRTLGFTGRSVSDLRHIAIVNGCFSPSEQQLLLAKQAITAYNSAVEQGRSDVFVDGVYLDPGIVDRYKRMIVYAKLIQQKTGKYRDFDF